MNVSEKSQRYEISVTGLDGIKLQGESALDVPSAGAKSLSIQVRVPPESGRSGSNVIYFDIRSTEDTKIAVHEKATFIQP
jgi:hypothetical protein